MKINKKYILRALFILSVLLNILLGWSLLIKQFNAPEIKTGILTKDIKIGRFGGKDTIFTLPKGLTVENATPRGFDAIDRFEPYRFSIVVSSDKDNLVDYSDKMKRQEYGNLYSADIKK